MAQTRNLYRKEDDKKKLPGNTSLATNTSGVCDEVSSHRKGCSGPHMNTFSNVPPSGVPPHTGGICLLGSAGEAEDLPLEAHQDLVVEILSAKGDASLKKYYVYHLLQSSKYQPDESLKQGSSG